VYRIVEGLARVRKPNVRMEFNVYVNSKSDTSVQSRRVCDPQSMSNSSSSNNSMLYYSCRKKLLKSTCTIEHREPASARTTGLQWFTQRNTQKV